MSKDFNKNKQPRKPSFHDNIFSDPDKIKKRKEQEEILGNVSFTPSEFSKSLDDIDNPKYNTSFKAGYTKKQISKFNTNEKDQEGKKSFDRRSNGNNNFDRNRNNSEASDNKSFEKRDFKGRGERKFDKSFEKKDFKDRGDRKFDKPFEKKDFKDRGERNFDKPFEKRGEKSFDKKTHRSNDVKKGAPSSFKKFEKKDHTPELTKEELKELKFKSRFTPFREDAKAYNSGRINNSKSKFDHKDKNLDNIIKADYNADAKMPLNKYIAKCGVCSRRDAVELIKGGKVLINNEAITEPGYKVQNYDVVKVNNKIVKPEEEFVYVLMNKPKGYITTLDDPKGRRIISELYKDEIEQRIFPVGRLDRNTTGLILLTNDGDLSQQLAHPKYQIKKIYQVELDKNVSQEHLQQILDGLLLEDGIAEVDSISYLSAKNEIGIEIHSGKNRIVRRIFEHLGYVVNKLDRVFYAGLTKKNLPKASWRLLTKQEVINLKHLGKRKIVD